MTIICPCCGEEICDEFKHCPECRFDIEQYNKEQNADLKFVMLENGKEAYAKTVETRKERKRVEEAEERSRLVRTLAKESEKRQREEEEEKKVEAENARAAEAFNALKTKKLSELTLGELKEIGKKVFGFAIIVLIIWSSFSSLFDGCSLFKSTTGKVLVADMVKKSMVETFAKNPSQKNFVVKDVSVVHLSDNKYKGLATVEMNGSDELLKLKVVFDGSTVMWEAER